MQKESNFSTFTGPIRYNLTNDYMFRATLQANPQVLKGLLGALLHVAPEAIEEISIENPILLGESFKDKKYILDILVKVNKKSLINLEMQVINEHNWNDRSLLYLCRVYSNLETGDEYISVSPATHIGFTNFTVTPNKPQFYSTYRLLDIKNHQLFSDKFTLCVVDLTQINLATEEDKAYQIDRWAKLFKANTWEDLRMLATGNEYMEELSASLFNCNMDPKICKQCQDWEFEQKIRKMDERYKEHLKMDIIKLEDDNAKLKDDKAKLEEDKSKLIADKSKLEDENARLRAQLDALLKSSSTNQNTTS